MKLGNLVLDVVSQDFSGVYQIWMNETWINKQKRGEDDFS